MECASCHDDTTPQSACQPRTCQKCGSPLPEGAVYCPSCGKKQVAEKRKRRKRGNGQGTVIKKPGNRKRPWEAQKGGVYIGVFATRTEAERALEQLADSPVPDTINLTFAQVYDRWFPEHTRTLSKSAVRNYKLAYSRCEPLWARPFRRIRASEFQAIIQEMEEKGLSKGTCEKTLQLFGQLSKWAIRENIASVNYAQFVKISATKKSTRKIFTDEQISRIKTSQDPAAQIALILLGTGCRPNELFSAKLENCHENYFVSGSKTEAGKNRIIPVSPIAMDAYTQLRARAIASGGDRLIDGYHGNRLYDNFAKIDWHRLAASLSIQGMTPYSFRHTYVTKAVEAGVRPEILQKILGHKAYGTTVNVYTHLGAEEIIATGTTLAVTDTLQTAKND